MPRYLHERGGSYDPPVALLVLGLMLALPREWLVALVGCVLLVVVVAWRRRR